MLSCPITFQNASFGYSNNTLIENFSTQLIPGKHVGLMGNNGSGKSTILRTLAGELELLSGKILQLNTPAIGYIPQITPAETLSGAQNFHHQLNDVCAQQPDFLLLDEPTNHLDVKNRLMFFNFFRHSPNTIVVSTHDEELLRACDEIWHIFQHKIRVYTGDYDSYIAALKAEQEKLSQQLGSLKQEKKALHEHLMQEQQRAKKRKIYGEKKYRDNPLALKAARQQGEQTTGRHKKRLRHARQETLDALRNLPIVGEIHPTFHISTAKTSGPIIGVSAGKCGYFGQSFILEDIFLQIHYGDKIAIKGQNGAGKSTLFRAFMGDPSVQKEGSWFHPSSDEIGYLDQQYQIIATKLSALEHIEKNVPDWDHKKVRQHLNSFLLRTNNEVQRPTHTLSGGEKMRLIMALIAATPPKLLLLDEPTNNLDLTTKHYLSQFLAAYPGSFLLISHDEAFLDELPISHTFTAIDNQLRS